MKTHPTSLWLVIISLVIVSLIVAACGGAPAATPAAEKPAEQPAACHASRTRASVNDDVQQGLDLDQAA